MWNRIGQKLSIRAAAMPVIVAAIDAAPLKDTLVNVAAVSLLASINVPLMVSSRP